MSAPETDPGAIGYGLIPWRRPDCRAMLASMISMGPRDRSPTRDQLASWDNEGGAPLSDRHLAEETQAALAAEEENILRCLGAAVIMRWNDLPTHIQRHLFEMRLR